MAPTGAQRAGYYTHNKRVGVSSTPGSVDWRHRATDGELVLESWSQGLIVGALLIMAFITIANMRRKVLLHKLILAELFLAMSHGTFCFMTFRGYGWYLSSTAALLYFSWIIHNVVTFMKIRPFLKSPGGFFSPRFSIWTKRIYVVTLAAVVPIIVFQISDNFRYFNNRGGWYRDVRPYEPLFRDPWWVFCCLVLFDVIRRCYGTGIVELVRRAPRFGILLASICISLIFTAIDIAASIRSIPSGDTGINPWWKLSLVFKCLTDTIMLDDFKTELKRLGYQRIIKEEKKRNSIALIEDRDPDDLAGSDDESATSGSNKERRSSHGWYVRGWRGRATHASPPAATRTIDTENEDASESRPRESDYEHLEFSTALTLSPSETSESHRVHDEGTTSVSPHSSRPNNAPSQQREEVHGHKTRIAHLPNLKQWTFEPIKSSKNSKRRNNQTDPESQAVESEVDPATPRTKQTPDQSGGEDQLPRRKRDQQGEKANQDVQKVTNMMTGEERRRRFRKSIGASSQ